MVQNGFRQGEGCPPALQDGEDVCTGKKRRYSPGLVGVHELGQLYCILSTEDIIITVD